MSVTGPFSIVSLIEGMYLMRNRSVTILGPLLHDVNETAINALREEKFTVKETDVIVVGVKDEPNGLNTMLEILEKESINVEYLYAFVSSKTDEAIVVVKIENYEDGLKALKDANANLLSKEDLAEL